MRIKYEFLVGNERKIGVWMDRWCGEVPLCRSFPSLFALISAKEAWVVDMWREGLEMGGWEPCFFKAFNDWKLEDVDRF